MYKMTKNNYLSHGINISVLWKTVVWAGRLVCVYTGLFTDVPFTSIPSLRPPSIKNKKNKTKH